MKRINLSVALLISFCGLSSCSTSDKTTKEINVYHYKARVEEKIKGIFFKELKEMPYLNIKDYYRLLLVDKELNVEKINDSLYKLTNVAGSAFIDVDNDTLESDDYNEFINTTMHRKDGVKNTYYDGAKYIKVGDATYDQAPTKRTIDFKKYHIDIKEIDNEIYMPYRTLADMFIGVTMYQSFFDGKNIYFCDTNGTYSPDKFIVSSSYINNIKEKFFKNEKRSEAFAKYTYDEMCFALDTNYGFPPRALLASSMFEKGFDGALSTYSERTKNIKNYLLSSDVYEYYAGLYALDEYLDDHGHTVLYGSLSYVFDDIERFHNNYINLGESVRDVKFNAGRRQYTTDLNNVRTNALRKLSTNNRGYYYNETSDTAIYSFDMFDIDYDGWDTYYRLLGKSKLPNDAIGNFIKACDLALEDGKKNLAIDLTLNGGGCADVVFAMFGIMSGDASFKYRDFINKQNVTQQYQMDINLDGIFDDNDQKYDLNFTIVTSHYSFSCANLLPAGSKDRGIFIYGNRSGGGSCCVLDGSYADGMYMRYSAPMHLMDKNFESADFGVEPDYDITGEFDIRDDFYDANGNYFNQYKNYFPELYDLDLLSEKANEFYH